MSRVMTTDGIVTILPLRFQISPVAKPTTLRICACSLRQPNPAQPAVSPTANQPPKALRRLGALYLTVLSRLGPSALRRLVGGMEDQWLVAALHSGRAFCANPIQMNSPDLSRASPIKVRLARPAQASLPRYIQAQAKGKKQ